MDEGNSKKGVVYKIVQCTAMHGFWLAIRLLGAIVSASIDIIFAYIIVKVIDNVVAGNLAEVKSILILMCIAVAVGIITAFINRYSSGKLGAYTLMDIKGKVVQHTQELPVSYMEKTDIGKEISRLTLALSSIQNFIENELPQYILQPLRLMAAVVFMALINWKLLLFTIVIIPVMILIASVLSSPITKYSERIQRHNGDMNSIVQDSISGIKIIKAFNLKDVFINKYAVAVDKMLNESLLLEKRKAVIMSLTILVQLLPFLSCFIFGGLLAIKGQLTTGELVAFIQLVNYIVLPAALIPGMLASLGDLRGKAGYVFEIFDNPIERKTGTSDEVEGLIKDREKSYEAAFPVEFENVDFYYHEEKKVLNQVSFTAGPKNITALVSASGGGKSTILKLICGFYNPVGGSIRINGKNMSTADLEEIRKDISLVPQHIFLFPGTVAENIAYGKPGASLDEIRNAARDAGAHNFIMELPSGYETIIDENGSNLSGGQCQRLTIARALISGRPVLLMDEPTSALDSENEMLFHDCLENVSTDRTVIIAAHRLSTVKRAQKIIVLDNGAVAAMGAHDELIRNCDVYRDLYERQMKKDNVDDVVLQGVDMA